MKKVNLLKGDCLEQMKTIPSKSVDMILCDLPCERNKYETNVRLDLNRLWKQYKRVIKDNGCIVLFARRLFYVDLVNSNRKWFRYDLIWDKQLTSGFLNANRMPLRQHEQIAVFYKKMPTYNPQFTQGEPLHSKGKSFYKKQPNSNVYRPFGCGDDTRAGTVQKHPKSILSFAKPHPSVAKGFEKSLDLICYLIKTYTNEGDVVLDNCMGVGSTGIACVKTNRNFIGIELNENNYDIAKDKIEKEIVSD